MSTAVRAALAIALFVLAGCATPPTITPSSNMAAMNGMDTTMGATTRSATDDLIIVLMDEAYHDHLSQGGSIRRNDQLPARYAGYVADLARRYDVKRVADWPLLSIGVRCLVLRNTGNRSRADVIDDLSSHDGIAHVQPLQYFSTLAEPTYNDPYVEMQHNLDALNVIASHRWATGKGVRVAVIDTGLDDRHTDLASRVLLQRNFVDRDRSAFRADHHGTAVAGVIAARHNNGTGMVGVAPEADVIALKSCWQRDSDSATCSSFTLAKALNFAITQHADVINLSLGGPHDELLARLVRAAVSEGITVVGAVHPNPEATFPSALPEVIAVTTPQAPGHPGSEVVRAPGQKILSTRPNNAYEFGSGSSFSAAQVSGIVALLKQRKPHIAPALVKELLVRTANNGTVDGCRVLVGYITGGECDG